jgi:thiamine biosynthesis protein ThiI
MELLSLLSGGIDSPVAAYLMIKKGMKVDFLHFVQNSTDKVKRIVKKLGESSYWKNNFENKPRLFLVPHLKVVELVHEVCPKPKLTCVYCKVIMLKTAEQLSNEIAAKAIVTGDSLGQVASQTIPNLFVEDRAVKIPVLRPLIGLDKVEIVRIAREADTYGLSILPSEPCRAVPKKPATAVKPEEIDLTIDVSEILENIEEIEY